MTEVVKDQLTINRSKLEPWAFTVKKLGSKLPSYEDYVPVIERYQSSGFIKQIEQETDSTGRLHLHGIILLRRGFFRKFMCVEGFHTRLDQIYNEKGWESYITKTRRRSVDDFDCNAKEYSKFYLFGEKTVEV